jgi:hypothetical protein
MTNTELLDLLREARGGFSYIEEAVAERECDCPPEWPRCDLCRVRHMASRLERRIKAALAEPQDSAKDVVKSDDLWWTPSSHRAKQGKLELHVWRMGLEEWGWSTYIFLEREVGSGVCTTEAEAKSAAIAAARGTR